MSFGVIGALVSVLCALGLVFWMRRAEGEVVDGPTPHRPWTVAIRVADGDEALALSLLAGESQETVVDLMRLAPRATHFYAGAPTEEFRSELPGGVVLCLDTQAAHAPVEDLAGVVSLLGHVKDRVHVRRAKLGAGGTFLYAVDETERPGHRQCAFCRQSFVISEFECPSCGGAVTR